MANALCMSRKIPIIEPGTHNVFLRVQWRLSAHIHKDTQTLPPRPDRQLCKLAASLRPAAVALGARCWYRSHVSDEAGGLSDKETNSSNRLEAWNFNCVSTSRQLSHCRIHLIQMGKGNRLEGEDLSWLAEVGVPR